MSELAIKGNSTVSNYLQFYLTSMKLDGTKTEHSKRERELAENALMLISKYALEKDIKLSALDQISVINNVKSIVKLGINASMRETLYVVDYDGKIVLAPYKNGFTQLFQNFGMNVNRILDIWYIRQGDEFKMPRYVGAKMTDAEYQQNSTYGKVLKVCVVYETKDKQVKYAFSERNNVIPSLIAHIQNANRKDKDIDKHIQKIKELDDIDKALEYILPLKNQWGGYYCSPAWRTATESMLETKMLGAITRKFPTVEFVDVDMALAYNDVINAEYQDSTAITRSFDNDEKLKEDLNNGVVGSETVVEQEQEKVDVNVSKDFVEVDEKPSDVVVEVVEEEKPKIDEKVVEMEQNVSKNEKNIPNDKSIPSNNSLFTQENKAVTPKKEEVKEVEDDFASFLKD